MFNNEEGATVENDSPSEDNLMNPDIPYYHDEVDMGPPDDVIITIDEEVLSEDNNSEVKIITEPKIPQSEQKMSQSDHRERLFEQQERLINALGDLVTVGKKGNSILSSIDKSLKTIAKSKDTSRTQEE